jgi:hypothetical protein
MFVQAALCVTAAGIAFLFLIRSRSARYSCGMTNASTLRLTDSAEVADAIAYALRYDGNWRVPLVSGSLILDLL